MKIKLLILLSLLAVCFCESEFLIYEKTALDTYPADDFMHLETRILHTPMKTFDWNRGIHNVNIVDARIKYIKMLRQDCAHEIKSDEHTIEFTIHNDFDFEVEFFFVYNWLIFPFSGSGVARAEATDINYSLRFPEVAPIENIFPLFSANWKIQEVNLGNDIAQTFGCNQVVLEALEDTYMTFFTKQIQLYLKDDVASHYKSKYAGHDLVVTYPYAVESPHINIQRRFETMSMSANFFRIHFTEFYLPESNPKSTYKVPDDSVLPKLFTRGYYHSYDVLKTVYREHLNAHADIQVHDTDISDNLDVRLDIESFAVAMPDYAIASEDLAVKLLLHVNGMADQTVNVFGDHENKKIHISNLVYKIDLHEVVVTAEAKLTAEIQAELVVLPMVTVGSHGVILTLVYDEFIIHSVSGIVTMPKNSAVIEDGLMRYLSEIFGNLLHEGKLQNIGETLLELDDIYRDETGYIDMFEDGFFVYSRHI
jgi:hypothetical protein